MAFTPSLLLTGVVRQLLPRLAPAAAAPIPFAAVSQSPLLVRHVCSTARLLAASCPKSSLRALSGSCPGPVSTWVGCSGAARRFYSSEPPPRHRPTPAPSVSLTSPKTPHAVKRTQSTGRAQPASHRAISQSSLSVAAEASTASVASPTIGRPQSSSTLGRVREFFALKQFDEPLGKTAEATTVENEPKISYRRLYELALTEKVRSIGVLLPSLFVGSIGLDQRHTGWTD